MTTLRVPMFFDNVNAYYQHALATTMKSPVVETRNAQTRRCFTLPCPIFDELPLVTLRKTSWKLALREMEWFLSGNPKCPDELLPWWKDQLNPEGMYIAGYSQQLRSFNGWFDQIDSLIGGLLHSPYSRRHVITTWDPEDMASITAINKNPLTPTTCHTSFAQFFVEGVELHMLSVQRSADLLLGVPHNWVQSWAMLVWLAKQVDLDVGSLRWVFGDAHIYQEPSHIEAATAIINASPASPAYKRHKPWLEYHGEKGKEFGAEDFTLEGVVADPVTTVRPKLL